MSGPLIAMIAAVAADGTIGNGGELPWRLPTDFAFYKATTMGKPLVMGRKTFESIGRPLPGRTNIVVTRQPDFRPEGVEVFASLDDALAHAKMIATRDGVEEVMINGGGEIYALAMPLADRLYITHVEARPGGDTRFPGIDPDQWRISVLDAVQPTERDTLPFTVRLYDRVRPSGFH
ncbi:dihydrofolate reductase [Pelagibacterium montanilacus]|uniref:dihydrofolate reductase n=1 Tax=Pelagibacterium montanilacus TaxID=2185280 RepID=UPI000F8CD8D4|nr:dihydrofolate reductase [Pelagibacterium montanilacus]